MKRYVVERCIYGVDLDPLAVELARLALWIETMDRDAAVRVPRPQAQVRQLAGRLLVRPLPRLPGDGLGARGR